MKEWQFNVLFFVGVGGAILLLIGPSIGLEVGRNPLAVSGVGSILGYVLTQKKHIVKKDEDEDKKPPGRHRKGDAEDDGRPD